MSADNGTINDNVRLRHLFEFQLRSVSLVVVLPLSVLTNKHHCLSVATPRQNEQPRCGEVKQGFSGVFFFLSPFFFL